HSSSLHTFLSPLFLHYSPPTPHLHSFPTRRSSDLSNKAALAASGPECSTPAIGWPPTNGTPSRSALWQIATFVLPTSVTSGCFRSEEHTSELQSLRHLVCRLLLEKKKKQTNIR